MFTCQSPELMSKTLQKLLFLYLSSTFQNGGENSDGIDAYLLAVRIQVSKMRRILSFLYQNGRQTYVTSRFYESFHILPKICYGMRHRRRNSSW